MSTVKNWPKTSDEFNLELKSKTRATRGKISDRRDLWKESATAQPEDEVSNGLLWSLKKVSDKHNLGKNSATGTNWKKVSDMRKQGKNQRQARRLKEVSDGANWKWSQQRTLVIWNKNKRPAQPGKKVSHRHNLEQFNGRRNLKKKSETNSCEQAKKNQRHA